LEKQCFPAPHYRRLSRHLVNASDQYCDIKEQVDEDYNYRNTHCFLESLEKNRPQSCDQDDRHDYPVMKELKVIEDEGVLDNVGRGIGCRQRDRNDEAGSDESQQGQHEQLSLPTGKQILQH
jgi:hypothetical protein